MCACACFFLLDVVAVTIDWCFLSLFSSLSDVQFVCVKISHHQQQQQQKRQNSFLLLLLALLLFLIGILFVLSSSFFSSSQRSFVNKRIWLQRFPCLFFFQSVLPPSSRLLFFSPSLSCSFSLRHRCREATVSEMSYWAGRKYSDQVRRMVVRVHFVREADRNDLLTNRWRSSVVMISDRH